MAVEGQENVALAFLLVTCAGLATGLGAGLVLFKRFVALTNKKFLAGSLSASAGVMLYVSFAEIFAKSLSAFEEGGLKGTSASGPVYLATTGCFFAGVFAMLLVDKVAHLIGGHYGHGEVEELAADFQEEFESSLGDEEVGQVQASAGDSASSMDESESVENTTGVGQGAAPVGQKKLKEMGLKTAISIGLHNAPEGLATFVATLADPSVGAALAVAIACHNIPEGLAVSIPVYYATGSRAKGLLWAFFSGITEPIGALLGYLVLMHVLGPIAYGVVFGVVAGMMVYIVVKELLPTAHRYDPHDQVSTLSLVCGMMVMATSLVLFFYEPEAPPCA